jgi:hypothetical protein
MSDDTIVLDSQEAEISEQQPETEKVCMPCLLPGIITAWSTARAVCEFLPDPESKAKCRAQMEEEAKDIKTIQTAETVMIRALEKSEDPEAMIRASIKFAQQHNATNTSALLHWAATQEASGVPISEDIMKIIKVLRLEAGI